MVANKNRRRYPRTRPSGMVILAGSLLFLFMLVMTPWSGAEISHITRPGAPTALASPQAVYIDWPANPEYGLRGYNIYRTETTAEGEPVETEFLLNRAPWQRVEYNDRNIEKDKVYIYKIQAVGASGQLSELSPPSPPVKGKWLRVFFPTVNLQDDGLYLWEHSGTREALVRIPVAVECAYDINMASSDIWAELPARLLSAEGLMVKRTGITADMAMIQNIITEGDTHTLGIVSATVEGRSLYGAGELFHIYMKPEPVTELECGPLHLIPDSAAGRGVRLYDDSPIPQLIALELEDGQFCTSRGDCLHGDANNDGGVDALDAQHILDWITRRVSVSDGDLCYPRTWDINLDGRVNTQDATLILRYVKGLPINPDFTKSDVLESFAAAAQAIEKTGGDSPEIWIDTPILAMGDTALTSVSIAGAAPLAGFSISIAYAATELTYLDVLLGDSLSPEDFLVSVNNEFSGPDNENGTVTIAVTGSEPLKKSSASELLQLRFTRVAGEVEEMPVEISAFVMNDPFSHAPRHTDPMAPEIVKGPLIPAAVFCTVLDGNSHAPITNATLMLSPLGMSVTHNVRGTYAMSAIPPGYYTLTVNAPGYEPHALSLIANSADALEYTVYLIPLVEGEGEGEIEGEGEGEEEGEGENEKKRRILFCGHEPHHNGNHFSSDTAILCLLSALLLLAARRSPRLNS